MTDKQQEAAICVVICIVLAGLILLGLYLSDWLV